MSTDQTLLRTILQNHILKLKITLKELYNGQLLETWAGKWLRVFIYRTVRPLCVRACVCVGACVCLLLHRSQAASGRNMKTKQEVMERQRQCFQSEHKSTLLTPPYM